MKEKLAKYRADAKEAFAKGFAIIYPDHSREDQYYLTALATNALMSGHPSSDEFTDFNNSVVEFNDQNGFLETVKFERVIALYMRVSSEIQIKLEDDDDASVTLPETSVNVAQRIYELCVEMEENAKGRDDPDAEPDAILALRERFEEIGEELEILENRLTTLLKEKPVVYKPESPMGDVTIPERPEPKIEVMIKSNRHHIGKTSVAVIIARALKEAGIQDVSVVNNDGDFDMVKEGAFSQDGTLKHDNSTVYTKVVVMDLNESLQKELREKLSGE